MSLDFLRCLAFKIAHTICSLVPRKSGKQANYIFVFEPPSRSRWILDFIIDDIAVHLNHVEILRVETAFELFRRSVHLSRSSYVILCKHQSVPHELIVRGFSPANIISIYSHSRLSFNRINTLNRIHKILVVNHSEKIQLLLAGIQSSKIQLFRPGIDLELFSPPTDSQIRDIDIVICGRFSMQPESHYFIRKNYINLRAVVEYLSDCGLTLALIGPGWNRFISQSIQGVKLFEVGHKYTPDIFRRSKVYLNYSLYEGGPVSLLEAYASGCSIVSTPSGWALDLFTEDRSVMLLPPDPSPSSVCLRLQSAVDKFTCPDQETLVSRHVILQEYTFPHLASQLENISRSTQNARPHA